MMERVWLAGWLCAACIGYGVVGCSSSDAGGGANGGSPTSVGGSSTSAGGSGSSMAGSSSSAGGSKSTAGGTSSNAGTGGMTSGGAGSCTPNLACKPVAPNTGDPYADCVARVNQFRACDCKPPLTQDKDGQACADQQAAYDAMKMSAHAGFGDDICKPDFFAQNECPGYGSKQDTIDGCAQQMFDEGPGPTNPCDGACYQAHGHFINMTGNYKMVTCGFATDADGKTWTVQNYR